MLVMLDQFRVSQFDYPIYYSIIYSSSFARMHFLIIENTFIYRQTIADLHLLFLLCSLKNNCQIIQSNLDYFFIRI